jgi:hypothetical protein
MENKQIEVTLGDHPEYEDEVAFIETTTEDIKDLVAIISQEEGYENLKISMPLDIPIDANVPYKKFPTFKLKDFEAAIERAKKRLWETRRIKVEEEDEEKKEK